MASAGGLGWPGESRRSAAAPADEESHVESSGLGWPHGHPGYVLDQIRYAGADKERETVAQADQRAEEEPPARVRQALSAAVSRETEDRTRGDDAVGGRPGGDSPADVPGRAPAGDPGQVAGGQTDTGRVADGRGAAAVHSAPAAPVPVAAPGPARPAMTVAEAALAAL